MSKLEINGHISYASLVRHPLQKWILSKVVPKMHLFVCVSIIERAARWQQRCGFVGCFLLEAEMLSSDLESIGSCTSEPSGIKNSVHPSECHFICSGPLRTWQILVESRWFLLILFFYCLSVLKWRIIYATSESHFLVFKSWACSALLEWILFVHAQYLHCKSTLLGYKWFKQRLQKNQHKLPCHGGILESSFF